MRSKDFLDWLLKGLLLFIVCGLIAGLRSIGGLDYGDPLVTMRAVFAVWITFGLARFIHYRVKN